MDKQKNYSQDRINSGREYITTQRSPAKLDYSLITFRMTKKKFITWAVSLLKNVWTHKKTNISHLLTVNNVLPRFGLKGSVEDLCEKYSNSWIVFKFKSENINRYNESFEIKIHNIKHLEYFSLSHLKKIPVLKKFLYLLFF